jgi:serine/threonine-protein kinase HipA
LEVLGEVHAAVANWRLAALSLEVGLRAAELDDFMPAFEHEQMDAAVAALGCAASDDGPRYASAWRRPG